MPAHVGLRLACCRLACILAKIGSPHPAILAGHASYRRIQHFYWAYTATYAAGWRLVRNRKISLCGCTLRACNNSLLQLPP
ncbi:hypothetical protein GQ53DRAFT_266181 [Thozetella sp. PMI_491]|nr:hypothetical protein GQ53DRAFT_266181 [Thozetella sp. PMI_491]